MNLMIKEMAVTRKRIKYLKFEMPVMCLALFSLLIFGSCKHNEEVKDHSVHHINKNDHGLDASLRDIINLADKEVISDQQTIAALSKESGIKLTLNGFISPDQRRDYAVATRISGRIEKLFVKYNYQFIQKGDKILEIYSPELKSSQEEYLYLLKNSTDQNLIESGKKKLLLLGLSEKQTKILEQTGSLTSTITIFSPSAGYILLDPGSNPGLSAAETKSSGGMGMSSTARSEASSSPENLITVDLKEGSYVTQGQTLFRVNDFKEVWAVLTFPTENQRMVKLNTPVTVFPEQFVQKAITGKIDFIEPAFSEGIQFVQARVYLKNPNNKLKANSLVTAEINPSGTNIIMVPNSSISDLGGRKIVWIKTKESPSGKNIFTPKTVITGFQSKDFTEIMEGLKEGDLVAKDAGYLLDSESIIGK